MTRQSESEPITTATSGLGMCSIVLCARLWRLGHTRARCSVRSSEPQNGHSARPWVIYHDGMDRSAHRTGELLRRARRDIGYTQSELASRAGTSQAALSAIESGSRVPSDELALRLLDAALLRPSIPLALYADELQHLAAQHGLGDLRVFGSVARGDDGPDSDVDILASRRPGASALDVLSFPEVAAGLLGFPVDLVLDDSRGAALAAIKKAAVPL
jgi:uncharacterized protein